MNSNNNDDFQFPKPSNEYSKQFIEIPPSHPFQNPEKIYSGFEPLESIGLEGSAYRNLSKGNAPRWVMWSSWLFLGFPSLFVCGIILAEMIELAKQSLIKADTAEHLYIVFFGIIGIGGSMMFAGVMFYIWVKGNQKHFRQPKR